MEQPRVNGLPGERGVDFYRSSPLMHVESFEGLYELYTDFPDILINILNEAFEATQSRLPTTSSRQSPSTEAQLTLFSSTPGETTSLHSPIYSPNRSRFPTVVIQASRLAAQIYQRAIKERLPYEHPANFNDAKHLGTLLNESPLIVWQGIPFIYLWM